MPNCPNCGNAFAEGASSCEKCGAPLAANVPPSIDADRAAQAEKKLFARRVWILVAVIAFLCLCPIPVAILYPVIAAARFAATTARETGELRPVAHAVINFAADHEDRFPDFQGGRVGVQIAGYLPNPVMAANADTYVWNTALQGHTTTQIQNRSMVWLVHSREPDRYGRYVVGMLDGHIFRVPADRYQSTLSQPIAFAKP